MGRRQGSHRARGRVAAGLAAAFLLSLAGCNANYAGHVSSFGAPAAAPPASASFTAVGTGGGVLLPLLMLGSLGMASGLLHIRDPEMHPDRRVVERDCTQPIEDHSANLRCR
jgi:hypothetical protein